ncbi:hypothetical protein AB4Y89_23410 [Terriglobus sp. 2YAB30_2]|uniref:hypothetical protein n=1 Tax=unclassified Terriglobus TaxID=2628988 RepID=UPI003F9B6465
MPIGTRLASWSVIGWTSAIIFSAGIGALSLKDQFIIARFCFVLAPILIWLKFLLTEFEGATLKKRVALAVGSSLCVGLLGFLLDGWIRHTENSSRTPQSLQSNPSLDAKPNITEVFVHDWSNQLEGIFVVLKLDQDMNLEQLGDYAFVAQLTATSKRPEPQSILIGGFNRVANGGLGMVRGHQSMLWKNAPVTGINQTFLWRYGQLNRLEAGGSFDGKSPLSTLHDLDHAFLQFYCSPILARHITRISIFANDYEIYRTDHPDFSRKRMWRDRNFFNSLQPEMKGYNYLAADLRQFSLDFTQLRVRRVPILFGGIVWTPYSATILPGEKGWLPRAVLDD